VDYPKKLKRSSLSVPTHHRDDGFGERSGKEDLAVPDGGADVPVVGVLRAHRIMLQKQMV
jgi:hypothetical protein